MSRRKTQEEFINEVYDLVGDEYTVLGEYQKYSEKLLLKHNNCGYEWMVTPNSFLSGHRCPKCANSLPIDTEIFVSRIYKINPNIKILGEYTKAINRIKTECLKCGGVWNPKAMELVGGSGCPFCRKGAKQILIGFNDIWTTNPELGSLLANKDDGYKYTENSMTKLDWKCPECGVIIKNKSISNVNRYKLVCNICSDGITYPNKLMFIILSQLNINFDTEKTFDWCKFIYKNKIRTGRYDFYFEISDKKYIIEMDGGFHYIDNNISGQTFNDSRYIDIQKEKMAIKNNINIIRIDAQKSNLKYIQNNILSSELSDILDLSSIDWLECEKTTLSSFKIQASKLWNYNHSTKEIANLLKRDRSTIVTWLKQCSKIGLCDYDSFKESEKALETIKKSSCNKTSVICLETGIIYNSIVEASKAYNISNNVISSCCRKNIKSTKLYSAGKTLDGTKLHWKYA